MSDWIELIESIQKVSGQVDIGIVGKYVSLPDSYLSVVEALRHAGFALGKDIEMHWIDAEQLETGNLDPLAQLDGIVVPGGFGVRGVEGKIKAVQYARENNIPFFGIALGMQCAVMEFARNVAGLPDAGSIEFGHDSSPVISFMPGQPEIIGLGGSMRLGTFPCVLTEGSRSFEAYQQSVIHERHRHRYELNNGYRELLVESGLQLSGLSPDGELVEVVELPNHPWFVGTQFHPEFKSRPTRPHPLFVSFVKAAISQRER